MKVTILQGLPGSGKSTYAEQLRQAFYADPDNVGRRFILVSADNYFTVGGEYKFDPSKLADAHHACLREYLQAMFFVRDSFAYHPDWYALGHAVVDNTNSTLEEVARYYALAEAVGAEVEILYFPCSVDTAISRNIHNVPRHIIEGMSERLEAFGTAANPIPGWWVRRIANNGR